MAEHLPPVVVDEPYTDAEQQQSANRMGMWAFLTSEVMLFGGVFMGMLAYRVLHPDAVAEAARHTDLWIGTVNTAVLLTSSLTVALAVFHAHHRRTRKVVGLLVTTQVIGLGFLGLKAYEYHKEYTEGLMPGIGPPFPLHEDGAELFWNLYYVATGLHAIHLLVGLGLLASLTVAWRRGRAKRLPEATEAAGLYWHLVDVIWIWLYPLIYLVG